jgi:uncharacterized cupredoxin-like copper-binding protein
LKGLLAAVIVVLAAAPAVDWSKARPMTVVMVDDRFQPDHLTFEHGVPYRLHLDNRGKDLHEFTAPEFFAASVVRNPGKLANEGKEVVVQPGESTDIYLEPLKVGTFHLTCADHDWDGMIGSIIVK